MASLAETETEPESGSAAPNEESLEEMKARHAKELKDVQYQGRQRVKAAKVEGGKGLQERLEVAKAQNMQAEDDIQYRHSQELEALEDRYGDADAFAKAERELQENESAARAAAAAGGGGGGGGGGKKGKKKGGVGEKEGGAPKKSKAQKRREKELAKAREREERIAAEKAGMGPTPRELETTAILRRLEMLADGISSSSSSSSSLSLSQPPKPALLGVHEVLSDGHCLFRAVHHQLQTKGLLASRSGQAGKNSTLTFQDLREQAAGYIASHPDDFVPFLDLSDIAAALPTQSAQDNDGNNDTAGGDAFRKYCRDMAETAQWGGHPEILALTKVLRLPIRVHSAEGPALVMGWEEFGGEKPGNGNSGVCGGDIAAQAPSSSPILELTFHRHFYALGEHYNSTLPR